MIFLIKVNEKILKLINGSMLGKPLELIANILSCMRANLYFSPKDRLGGNLTDHFTSGMKLYLL